MPVIPFSDAAHGLKQTVLKRKYQTEVFSLSLGEAVFL
jgi:hypothetical protein